MVAGGQRNFLRLQIVFKFCCSYFFLVFSSFAFAAVGSDKICKPLLFFAAGVAFFFSLPFSFHTVPQSCFVFRHSFWVDTVAVYLFLLQFLKSYLALQC